MKLFQLSVVIPAYNAEHWLEPTVEKINTALSNAKTDNYEIIIVNDGSRDGTKRVADALHVKYTPRLTVISHANRGRYLTRKEGVRAARYDQILFIDTRVWVDKNAILFLRKQFEKHSERTIWNGHINVAKKGNIIARFGDALTFLGWRRYFKHPVLTSYGHRDFDHYPKGTGLFVVPKSLITEAFEWFEKNTSDIKNSSDDTLLIRHLSDNNRIWLSPEFSAIYFARTTLKAFLAHTYFRGQFFVDGFLRKGTRFYYPLLVVLVLTPSLLALLILYPAITPEILVLGLGGWILLLPFSLVLGLSVKDAFSLFLLSPLFAFMYVIGIWTAVIRKVVK